MAYYYIYIYFFKENHDIAGRLIFAEESVSRTVVYMIKILFSFKIGREAD